MRTGTPQQVWDDPRTTFVATFIGHANVLTGSAIGLDAPAVTVPPDALRLTDEGSIEARIKDSVFRDGRYEVAAQLNNGEQLRIDSPYPADLGLDARVDIDWSAVRELAVDEV